MMFPEFMPLARASLISIGLVLGGAGSAIAASDQEASSSAVTVVLDRAKVVRIAKSADTIIIGNPSVVDATIQDARTIVLTGRNFGITNLIVLDSEGDVIVDETVVVKGSEKNLVRVFRQANRETLTCSPTCQNTIALGDNGKHFTNSISQAQSRSSLAESGSRTR